MIFVQRLAVIERAIQVSTCMGIVLAILGSTVATAFAQSAVLDQSAAGGLAASQWSGAEGIARKVGDDIIPSCNFARGNCGYLDQNGKIIIAPQFDSVERFREDRAVVVTNGLYGAIDRAGRFTVPAEFDLMSPFSDGLAQVVINGKLGVIDRDGHPIVPTEYGGIVRLTPHAFLVREPPYREARVSGFERLDALDEKISRYRSYSTRKWGIVARGGEWLVQPVYSQVQRFSDELNGLFWAANSSSSDAEWRLMRADGTAVMDETFDQVQRVERGQDRAIVARDQRSTGEPNGRKIRRWGAVDGGGRLVVPLKYDWLSYYRDGYAMYKLDGKDGRIDKDDNILPDRSAESPTHDRSAAPSGGDRSLPTDKVESAQGAVSEGMTASYDAGTRKWGFIDVTGNYTIPPQFDATGNFRKGLAWAAFPERQEWCLIDKRGNLRSDRRCQCDQPLVIVEHYSPPVNVSCYEAGLAVIGRRK